LETYLFTATSYDSELEIEAETRARNKNYLNVDKDHGSTQKNPSGSERKPKKRKENFIKKMVRKLALPNSIGKPTETQCSSQSNSHSRQRMLWQINDEQAEEPNQPKSATLPKNDDRRKSAIIPQN